MKFAILLLVLPFLAHAYPISYQIPNVPYDRQITVYDCGCAALQMVFSYWNDTQANQYYLANIARTSAILGTSALDMVRAGHFSILSASNGLDYPENALVNGIPGKPLGFASFGNYGAQWLDELKGCIASNVPIIILMTYAHDDAEGHYRVAVGYDDENQTISLHDPWGRDGQPHNVTYSYDDFLSLWNYTETAADPQGPFFGLMISPFDLQTNIHQKSDSRLVIQTVATYSALPPFTQVDYPVSNVLVSLTLPFPSNFTLSKNSTQTLNLGSVNPGEYVKASWEVECNLCSNFIGTIEVRGFVSGHVPSSKWQHIHAYPPYQYVDVIGGSQVVSF
eukprot:Phypoly_transcript_07348.p1 GENE.Phypoly_transcript_07348~~Phypoly_transcript_07348.p1  ORF type:complete len:336 (+),score=33.66 Phypoly_transcript_07348:114-1121(+)